MFNRRTTLVVGAGASCELGLPSGDKLKDDIRDIVSTTDQHAYCFTDEALLSGLRQIFPGLHTDAQAQIRNMAAAADRIRRGLPMAQSIDNFLHTHQSDELVRKVGMAAIARAILRAEQSCYLFESRQSFYLDTSPRERALPSLDNPDLQKSWYAPFTRLLFSLIPKGEPQRSFQNLRFVIFNYDRCLEEFLWLALQAYFDLEGVEAAAVLNEVEFIHPYGSLGPLPWQKNNGAESIPLGGANGLNCFKVGESLQTFTESVHGDTGAQVADAVADAEILLLLGFGYLEQNLQLLVPAPLEKRGAHSVLGTAYGIEKPNHEIIREILARMATASIEYNSLLVEPGKCIDLFQNYEMHLRF